MTETITAAWIAAGAALGGGLVAGLFSGVYQHLRDYWNRPTLRIDFAEDDSIFSVKPVMNVGNIQNVSRSTRDCVSIPSPLIRDWRRSIGGYAKHREVARDHRLTGRRC